MKPVWVVETAFRKEPWMIYDLHKSVFETRREARENIKACRAEFHSHWRFRIRAYAALSGKPALTPRQRKAIEGLRKMHNLWISNGDEDNLADRLLESVAAVLAEFKEEKARG